VTFSPNIRFTFLQAIEDDPSLSEAAIHHLMQLPNLYSWVIVHELPRTLPPVTFPPLQELRLGQAALPWLHLPALHEEDVIQNGFASATSHTNVRETLEFLDFPRDTTVDLKFLSSIVNFRDLVRLRVTGDCSDAGGRTPPPDGQRCGKPCRLRCVGKTLKLLRWGSRLFFHGW